MRIVTFNPHAASRGGGTPAEVSWRVSPVDRRLRRGKNDFFPRRGSRKRRCITWRDGETLASPTFVMSQSQLLLQLLVVAFDNPTVFRSFYQFSQCGLGRKSRKPVLGRFALPLRPFDQQPFFVTRLASPIVPMSRSYSQCRKTGAQFLLRSLTPGDRSPILGRQGKSHLLDRNRLMFSIPSQQLRWAPQPASWFCREWSFSRSPNRCVPAHANNIR